MKAKFIVTSVVRSDNVEIITFAPTGPLEIPGKGKAKPVEAPVTAGFISMHVKDAPEYGTFATSGIYTVEFTKVEE